jgi:hypothetical protein
MAPMSARSESGGHLHADVEVLALHPHATSAPVTGGKKAIRAPARLAVG